jgi:hypothetical protein
VTGSANRARLVLFGALLLAGFCLWQLAEAASEFFADKALAEQKYTRCLEKIERQVAIEKNPSTRRSQIWPCWHQQLAVKQYAENGALFVSLTPPNDRESGFYLATLLALSLAGFAVLKQR